MSDDTQLLRDARGLIRSITMDERRTAIQDTRHNAQLQALSLAAHYAVLAQDTNALRTALDTAFCLGVRAGREDAR